MVARGYTNGVLVAQEMGRALSGDEMTQAAGLIEEAEALIDAETGRAWLVTSPVANELHVLTSPSVYLTNTPVVSVTSVTIRSPAIGAVATTLAAGSGYELLDPTTGLLVVGAYPNDVVINTTSSGDGSILKVSYTFASPLALPADIRRAATLLVADWMGARSNTTAGGAIKSVSLGQGDVAITYDVGGATSASRGAGISALVADILKRHRRLMFA